MLYSEDIINDFEEQNKTRTVKTLEPKLQYIDPSRIIGINNTYEYPEILKDYKMKKLRKIIKTDKDWDMDDRKAMQLEILKFPNGDMVVNGNGNHRAVLAKELGLSFIKANVKEVQYVK